MVYSSAAAEWQKRANEAEAENARLTADCAALRKAAIFIKAWFQKLEDNTDADDPLLALRRRFHAPVHAELATALDTGSGAALLARLETAEKEASEERQLKRAALDKFADYCIQRNEAVAERDAQARRIAELEAALGHIAAALRDSDLDEAYHHTYLALVRDLTLPAEKQTAIMDAACDVARKAGEKP